MTPGSLAASPGMDEGDMASIQLQRSCTKSSPCLAADHPTDCGETVKGYFGWFDNVLRFPGSSAASSVEEPPPSSASAQQASDQSYLKMFESLYFNPSFLKSVGVSEPIAAAAPAPTHAQTDKDLKDAPPIGFSFSPAGLLIPYHLGAAFHLRKMGVITNATPISGASAGSLTACAVGMGLAADNAVRAVQRLAADCREKGTRSRLHDCLMKELDELLPPDAHEQLNGRAAPVTVAYTEVFPYPAGRLVSQFDSRDDLIEVLCASCCVPFYFSAWPLVQCRGKVAADGFFASELGAFGCPVVAARRTVRISPFPASVVGLKAMGPNDVITPDLNPQFPLSMPKLIQMSLLPADEDEFELLYQLGQQDAAEWIRQEEKVGWVEGVNNDGEGQREREREGDAPSSRVAAEKGA